MRPAQFLYSTQFPGVRLAVMFFSVMMVFAIPTFLEMQGD